jgi:NAD(P)-dependent dehydrogenase (short-subunit alcohol dehydrogenase family)
MTDSGTAKPFALVTGGNAGIGFETCAGLLRAGFHVIVGARSERKARAAVDALLQSAPEGNSAEVLVLDLSSFDSVRAAADAFLATERPLHVCVLNAGIMALPWATTADGFEQQWQVNVLGHFLLCRLLLPAMEAAQNPTGRVVHVASGAHRLHPQPVDYGLLADEHRSAEGYDQWLPDGRSKLANIFLSNELARRLRAEGSAVTSNALHPGNVNTGLWSKAGRKNESGISAEEGARTSLYLALSRDVERHTGGYFFQCKPVTRIYREEESAQESYAAKSAMRTQTSTSEPEARRAWAVASADVGLAESL